MPSSALLLVHVSASEIPGLTTVQVCNPGAKLSMATRQVRNLGSIPGFSHPSVYMVTVLILDILYYK